VKGEGIFWEERKESTRRQRVLRDRKVDSMIVVWRVRDEECGCVNSVKGGDVQEREPRGERRDLRWGVGIRIGRSKKRRERKGKNDGV